jgi:hypothetical protein
MLKRTLSLLVLTSGFGVALPMGAVAGDLTPNTAVSAAVLQSAEVHAKSSHLAASGR